MNEKFLTPIPPAIELPGPMVLPEFGYEAPEYIEPQWEPIIIYKEDIPADPKTKTNTTDQTTDSKKEPKKKTVNKQTNETPKLPEAPNSEFKEVQKFELPIVNVEVPVPKPEIIVTAATTATIASVASVGGTLAATAIFQRLIQVAKPVITFGLKKLAKIRGKQEPLTWARKRAAQRLRKSGKRASQV